MGTEVALNSAKKRRLTFCLRVWPRCSFVRVEHSVATLCFCSMARAIHSLSNFSPYLCSPSIFPHRLATGGPILSGFVSTPIPNASAATLLHDQACVQTFNSPPGHIYLSFPCGKVKSYGSVKAILSLLAFHVTPAIVFLRLFPAAGACKGLKYFNQSSWNMAVSTV